ncbi:hypothetical protein R3P38DRAFT_3154466, partial [Favolaschia claudopus]
MSVEDYVRKRHTCVIRRVPGHMSCDVNQLPCLLPVASRCTQPVLASMHMNGGARKKPGRRPGSGGATGSHRDGFVDRQGNRWCDMSMDGCHRCGERSHKAVSCIKEMPPEVKDWCLNRAYETAQLAADSTHFAAESTHPVASYFVQEPSAPSPS